MPVPTCSSGSAAAGEVNGHERRAGQSSSTQHGGWQTACPKTAQKLPEEEPSPESRCHEWGGSWLPPAAMRPRQAQPRCPPSSTGDQSSAAPVASTERGADATSTGAAGTRPCPGLQVLETTATRAEHGFQPSAKSARDPSLHLEIGTEAVRRDERRAA